MYKFVVLGLLIIACVSGEDPKSACVNLTFGDAKGQVFFNTTSDGIHVTGTITGLKPGKHGFHVHESGELKTSCMDAKGHFNPHNKDHGAPTDDNRHVGDLGNIIADEHGVAKIDITDKIIALSGENNIVNRSVVVHEGEDDLGRGGYNDSKTTGHAGARAGCGIIVNFGVTVNPAPFVLFLAAVTAMVFKRF